MLSSWSLLSFNQTENGLPLTNGRQKNHSEEKNMWLLGTELELATGGARAGVFCAPCITSTNWRSTLKHIHRLVKQEERYWNPTAKYRACTRDVEEIKSALYCCKKQLTTLNLARSYDRSGTCEGCFKAPKLQCPSRYPIPRHSLLLQCGKLTKRVTMGRLPLRSR